MTLVEVYNAVNTQANLSLKRLSEMTPACIGAAVDEVKSIMDSGTYKQRIVSKETSKRGKILALNGLENQVANDGCMLKAIQMMAADIKSQKTKVDTDSYPNDEVAEMAKRDMMSVAILAAQALDERAQIVQKRVDAANQRYHDAMMAKQKAELERIAQEKADEARRRAAEAEIARLEAAAKATADAQEKQLSDAETLLNETVTNLENHRKEYTCSPAGALIDMNVKECIQNELDGLDVVSTQLSQRVEDLKEGARDPRNLSAIANVQKDIQAHNENVKKAMSEIGMKYSDIRAQNQ